MAWCWGARFFSAPMGHRPDGGKMSPALGTQLPHYWSRINGTEKVSAIIADYSDAQSKGHHVYCGLIEPLYGTFSPGLCDFIALCADTHFEDAVHHSHLGYSWTAPSFTAHHAMRISTAFHKGMAIEMIRALDYVHARRPYKNGVGAMVGAHNSRRPSSTTFGDYYRRATTTTTRPRWPSRRG